MELALIEHEAMKLTEAERAVLADRLLDSLETRKIAHENLWLEESKGRYEEYRQGTIAALDGEATVTELRKLLRK